ncbi:MAG: multiubiquitin domain-containing protein [Patescibacteria group bacterium]|nr:multiubiquitin domain-containing protein [Patescibacteria group bacterium]
MANNEVEIHIDKNGYKSPNPTTGEALYKLGNVDPGKYDLFREVHGKGDDVLIPNNDQPLELENGEHFYTAQKNLTPGAQ